MTRAKPEAMKAGHELDALVAEKVMKWPLGDETAKVWFTVAPDAHVFHHDWEGRSDIDLRMLRHNTRRWSPSTDIAATWEVLKHVSEAGLYPRLELAKDGQWRCALHISGKFTNDWFHANTAPLAICRAALAAIETA